MSVQKPKPRGRPKDLDKRATILRAARQLFFGHGLQLVTIDQVAEVAAVSKMTVYANFPDKGALFEAVVTAESAAIDAAFANVQIGGGTIDVVLMRLGTTLIPFLLSPEVMRLDQMLGAAMTSHAGLGQRFYHAGPHRMWRSLTAIIAEGVVRGDIHTENPQQAAEDLISLWLGLVPLQHRFNDPGAMSVSGIAARVDHGVKVFMKVYAPDEKRRAMVGSSDH